MKHPGQINGLEDEVEELRDQNLTLQDTIDFKVWVGVMCLVIIKPHLPCLQSSQFQHDRDERTAEATGDIAWLERELSLSKADAQGAHQNLAQALQREVRPKSF